MMIDLSDYYSGGYFLIRAGKPDWPQLETELLPDKLVSLSECICPQLYVYWGWIPGDREAALQFGIPQDRIDAFLKWCYTDYRQYMAYPSMFYSPETARQFVNEFIPDTTDLYLIGIGLHQELEAATWQEDGESDAIENRIEEHLPMDKDGEILGFEVVSFASNDFGHSWICNYIYEDMNTIYDIRPGQYGLLQTHDDANRVYEWIAEDEMKGHRGEPEPYDYWLLVSYPIVRDA